MKLNRGPILLLSLLVAAFAISCGEAPPPDDMESTAPVFNPEEFGMVEQADGSFLLEEEGKMPLRLSFPERPEGVSQEQLPDGIFMRPHVDIFSIKGDETELVYLDKELSMIPGALVFVRAEAPMVHELRNAGPGDALFIEGTAGFMVARVIQDGQDLLFDVRPFHIGHVVYGNFRLEFDLVKPHGHYVGKNDGVVEKLSDTFDPELPSAADTMLDVRQQNLSIPISGMDIEVAKTFGSGAAQVEVKATGKVRQEVSGEFKGIFEGRIHRNGPFGGTTYAGEGYTCLNPEDEYWAGDFCVDRLAVYVEGGLTTSIEVDVEITGKLTATTPDSWERVFGSLETTIPGTPLTVGAETFAKWGIEVEAGVTAKFEKTKWEGTGTVPFGFEYINNTQFRSTNLPGNPDNGTKLVPNTRIGPEWRNGGIDWGEFTGEGYLGAKPFVEAGVRFKVGNAGPDVVKLTGAKVVLRGEYEIKYHPLQDALDGEDCLTGQAKLFGVVAPDITFQVGIEGLWTWKKNLFCSNDAPNTCAQLKTPNIFEFFRIPERIHKHSMDSVCIEPPEYPELIIRPVDSAPMGFEDPDGFDVDSVALSRTVGSRAGPRPRTWYATGGPSKLQGRADSSCDNVDSTVAGLSGETRVSFPVRLKPGDTVTLTKIRSVGQACEASGTAELWVEGDDGDKFVGTLEQGGELTIP